MAYPSRPNTALRAPCSTPANTLIDFHIHRNGPAEKDSLTEEETDHLFPGSEEDPSQYFSAGAEEDPSRYFSAGAEEDRNRAVSKSGLESSRALPDSGPGTGRHFTEGVEIVVSLDKLDNRIAQAISNAKSAEFDLIQRKRYWAQQSAVLHRRLLGHNTCPRLSKDSKLDSSPRPDK